MGEGGKPAYLQAPTWICTVSIFNMTQPLSISWKVKQQCWWHWGCVMAHCLVLELCHTTVWILALIMQYTFTYLQYWVLLNLCYKNIGVVMGIWDVIFRYSIFGILLTLCVRNYNDTKYIYSGKWLRPVSGSFHAHVQSTCMFWVFS